MFNLDLLLIFVRYVINIALSFSILSTKFHLYFFIASSEIEVDIVNKI